MPTMRDMLILILSERFAQIVDDGAQVRAHGKALLEPGEERRSVGTGVHRRVPVAGPAHQRLLLRPLPISQTLSLLAKPSPRPLVESARPRFLQRFLHLQHLLEEVPRSLGPRLRALSGVAPLLERDQILDARDGIAERAIG